MNLLKKIFSPTILTISFLLLLYTFYKSEIIWDGNNRNYYKVYYFISSILTVNGGSSLRTFSAAATNSTLLFLSWICTSLTGSLNFIPLKKPLPLISKTKFGKSFLIKLLLLSYNKWI